jgi:histidinol dehydrogenase
MSEALFRFAGPLAELESSGDTRGEIVGRGGMTDSSVRAATSSIIESVRARGDAALVEMAARFDGVTLESLEVPAAARRAALAGLSTPLRTALERSAANIRTVHQAFLPRAAEVEVEPGIVVGRRPDPLERVGIYAPGGRAAYPSSVLMGAVPARVAGVRELILCSPPGPSGVPSDIVLAAAELAGVDRVFAVGGAGAIAAMALGTVSVPPVQRIVGPGNAYVAEAKMQLAGMVGIDSPAGPSELLVLADASCSAEVVAREVLAQAEHDPVAAVVVVALDETTAQAIGVEVARLVGDAPRAATIRSALASRGAIMWGGSREALTEFSNAYAPEHLLLAVGNPEEWLPGLRHAGTIFLGESSSVAFGDYMTGANHVLPTGGLARTYSGLSTLDFVRWTTWQRVDRSAARRLAADVGALADAEELYAHAAAARGWGVGAPCKAGEGVR